ncbi:hypothetical protein JCM10450v2_005144 [Rhodotorula kratochvilovae]
MARSGKRRADDSAADARESSASATDYEDRRASKSADSRRKSTQKGKGKAKSKGKRARRDASSDDDDSDDATDDSDAGARDKKGDLSDDEKKHYIQAFVRYVLFNEAHRRVLKREDIVKNVLTDGRGRHFNALLPAVQKVLKNVMGMELHELRARETASGKSQGKAWVVRSTIPQPLLRQAATHRYPSLASAPGDTTGGKKSLRGELAAWEADSTALPDEDDGVDAAVMRDVKREEGATYGVLGVVLALILVNGKVLGDDQLISYLRRLSLTPSTPLPLSLQSPHPTSLDLSAFLNALVRGQYLERAKIGGAGAGTQGGTQAGGARTQASRTQRTNAAGEKAESGDPSIEWRWGPRAEAELGEKGVARFVERVFLSQSDGDGRKRARAGDRFVREVARAAGVKELAGTEGRARAKEDRE